MEGHRLWVKHKQSLGQRFILVLPEAATLPGSDAGSDVVEPATGFVIRPQTPFHVHCRLWGTLLKRGLLFVQWRRTRYQVKEQNAIVHGRMESANTSLQTLDLNRSCSKQAHSNRLGISHGYESTEPECILRVYYVLHL